MGWAFAIAGDMVYFAVLMLATLVLSGMFGDERVTVGVVLLAVWGLSMVVRRQQGASPQPVPVLTPALAAVNSDQYLRARPTPEHGVTTVSRRPPRKKAGRNRRSR